MSIRYKAIISSKNLYKEIELPADLVKVKVGTGTECDHMLRQYLSVGWGCQKTADKAAHTWR